MINAKEFIKALNELEATKGISKESIIEALKEAMEKGFIKQLGIASNGELEEAKVRVDIDAKKGTIEMYVLKTVVEEVEDCISKDMQIRKRTERKRAQGTNHPANSKEQGAGCWTREFLLLCKICHSNLKH